MIRRTKPLKRSSKPLKRSYIKRKPPDKAKQRANRVAEQEYKRDSPYSTHWRDMATTTWAKVVRLRANGICQYTGKDVGYEALEAHHVVPRGIYQCRTDLFNGIAINSMDHQRSAIAPHGGNPRYFQNWLRIERPEKYEYWVDNKTLSAYAKINWKQEYSRLTAIHREER